MEDMQSEKGCLAIPKSAEFGGPHSDCNPYLMFFCGLHSRQILGLPGINHSFAQLDYSLPCLGPQSPNLVAILNNLTV